MYLSLFTRKSCYRIHCTALYKNSGQLFFVWKASQELVKSGACSLVPRPFEGTRLTPLVLYHLVHMQHFLCRVIVLIFVIWFQIRLIMPAVRKKCPKYCFMVEICVCMCDSQFIPLGKQENSNSSAAIENIRISWDEIALRLVKDSTTKASLHRIQLSLITRQKMR